MWLVDDLAKVDGLVRDVFGVLSAGPTLCVGERMGVDFPYSREEVWEWVLTALGWTRNGSAPGPDGISYRLIKAVRGKRLGGKLVVEVVDNLIGGVIPPA